MQDRRKLPRYVLGASGKLIGTGPHAESVTVLVISMGGASIGCPNPPPIGQRCTLKIAFEGSEVEVTAEVRSREKTGCAGLMFVDVSDETRQRLKKICAGKPLAASSRPQGGR